MAMFLNLASVLHVFDITPARDEHGRPITIKPVMTDGCLSYVSISGLAWLNYVDGANSYPADCRCTIQPRPEEATALIRAQAMNGIIRHK